MEYVDWTIDYFTEISKKLKDKPPMFPKGPPSPIMAGHDHKRLSDRM